MSRTIRRQPFSVSTSSRDYPTLQTFAQSTFSGINESENQMTVDQNSFSDAKNVYVDRDGALVNRPPFVKQGDEFILDTWRFGSYVLTMYKHLCYKDGEQYIVLEDGDPGDHILSDLYYRYRLECTSGLPMVDDPASFKYPYREWYLSTEVTPKIACAQFARGIFCWFNGTDLVMFDIGEDGKAFFTEGARHLYYPVHETVVNRLASRGEGKNLFLDGYRRRYLLSTTSSVDFDELLSQRNLLVGDDYQATANYTDRHGASVKLYKPDLNDLANTDGKVLIHPKLPFTRDYLFTSVVTSRGTVILRYTRDCENMSIGFEFESYQSLPRLNDVVGEPMLTRDGLYVVAFTTTGLAFCKVVRSESTDFLLEDYFSWERKAYSSDTIVDYDTFVHGCFLSVDNYAYVAPHQDGSLYVHAKIESKEYTQQIDVYIASRAKDAYVWLNLSSDKTAQIIVFRNSKTPAPAQYLCLMDAWVIGEGVNVYAQKVLERIAEDELYDKNNPSPFTYLPGSIVNATFTKNDDGTISQTIGLLTSVEYNSKKYTITINDTENDTDVSVTSEDPDYGDALYYTPVYDTSDIFTEYEYIPNGVDSRYYGGIPLIPTPERPLQNGDVITAATYKEYRIYNISRGELAQGNIVEGEVILAPIMLRTTDEILSDPVEVSNRWILTKMPESVTDGIYYGETVTFTGKSYAGLPAGTTFTAKLGFRRNTYVPLFGTKEGIWIQTPNGLWTSELEDGELIEIDTFINPNRISSLVPEKVAALDDTYFSFTKDGKPMLGVTSPRREPGEIYDLLYADMDEAQQFVASVTNLHSLSDDILGIFTENEVWYVVRQVDSSNNVLHTRPVRSRIPFGCRQNADVITAFDGQAIIFAASRGIVALAPQDFVATTEKSLNYLSDNIDKTYRHFFNDNVKVIDGGTITPAIKIVAYQHWMLFYRYMDREILLFDTRNASWWKWTVPYPLRRITAEYDKICVLFDISFAKIGTHVNLHKSQFGSVFLLDTDKIKNTYEDDVVPLALNGDYEYLYGNAFRPARLTQYKAEPIIDWYFVSQKLHLNAPQNYKGIKTLYLNVRGDDAIQAKFITKVYRDTFHPVREETSEILINELRTFIKPVNLLHVTSFQYTIMNDVLNKRLRLDSLGIKYEVKEKLR